MICPLCGSDSRIVWKELPYRAYRCRICTTIFLDSIPADNRVSYGREYFESWYLHARRKRVACFRKYLAAINTIRGGRKGRVLDVGCGIGIFLGVAQADGWDVIGQDTSEFAATLCRMNGFKVLCEPLDTLSLPEGSFDMITMWDVIAHLDNPASYLSSVRRLLSDGGLFVIKTPHHPLLLFQFADFLSFTGRSRSILHVPAQLFHFTPYAMRNVLSRFGFRVKKIEAASEVHFSSGNKFHMRDVILAGLDTGLKLILHPESFIIYAEKS